MNSEYIKMVLALPDEFFEEWEWRHCDYAINLDNIEKGRATPLEEQFHTEFKILYVDSCFKDTEWVFKDRVRPIPSQEQLQEKCMALINCDAHDLLRFFEAWIYEDEIRPVVRFADFNDLWLKYTIWVWGRKEWNGEAWI